LFDTERLSGYAFLARRAWSWHVAREAHSMHRIHRASGRIGAAALILLATLTLARPWALFAQGPTISKVKFAAISEADVREWLTYLASDALQGRQVYTEGYGLAAAYIADRLKQFGVKPIGDAGYFQTVKLRSYRVTRNSSVTVQVGSETKTFKHGDHVTFPANSGGKQTLTFGGVEFAGYGMVNLAAGHDDFKGRDVKGKLVAWLPGSPPMASTGGRGGRGGGNRGNYMVQSLGVSAVLSYVPAPPPPTPADEALAKAQAALAQANQAVIDAQTAVAQARRGAGAGPGRAGGRGAAGGGGRGAATTVAADINQTPYRVDGLVAPQIAADDTFWEFVFSASPTKFADLKARAEKGEALPPVTLSNVKVTINIDNTFDVLSTQLTKNVVGMVEGSDPKLKDSYVMFGAHLDHVGYRTTPPAQSQNCRQAPPDDAIFNGADDDGSGSTGLLGIAKAFATGPKPKRSVVFVWHAGEEAGLLGSHYNADFPVVPLEKVQAQFNIDMIGRNRDDNAAEGSKVFVIGADRISTDLHNLVVDTNATFAREMDLDFEYNDPADPNSFYTRSDHYSYASKGIPIAFFFTGTHLDYHCVTDSVDRILFPKLVQIAQLVYQSGFNVANSDKPLERDNKGPRSGRGFHGRIDR
jgi:hypothetical protein